MSPYSIAYVKFDGWKVEILITKDGEPDYQKLLVLSADELKDFKLPE